MTKIALTGGAYQAHSVIASAQRSLNLFAEPMPSGNQYTGTTGQGEPSTHAHYPTPGLRLLGTIGAGPIRGLRQCTTGGVYVVSGSDVYSVNTSAWTGTSLGTITPGIKTPVSMQDNGLDMLIVDGSANGWDVTLAGNTMAQVSDPGGMFSGADRVDYLDTFFILNKPATPEFYISGSLDVTFDPLDFANKEAYSDLLVVAVVAKRLVYLFGERTTEIWYDAGATDIGAGSFPFAAMQSEVFIDHGCVAKYSPAVYDNSVFWLTRDRQGQGIVMTVSGYQTKRVSTYAIEAEISGYSRISDAIGFTYQIAGHSFYVLTFPEADHTWSYDISTGLWHEWLWIDSNGAEHRHRANCAWAVNDLVVVGDWQNGNLYALDNRVFTDNGSPIKRVRSFPHMLNDGKRVFYRQFLADMETGTAPQLLPGAAGPGYTLGLTKLSTPANQHLISPDTAGLPPTIAQLTISLWLCADPNGTFRLASFDSGVTQQAFLLEVTPGGGITINGRTYSVGVGAMTTGLVSYFPFSTVPTTFTLYQLLISIDMTAQTVQLYVNDVAMVPDSLTFVHAGPIYNTAFHFDAFGISNAINGLGDLWMNDQVIDFSVTVNRRKFINADLSPVDLGSNGAGPTGTAPKVFLHIPPSGVANDIANNYGTGGTWSITNGPLVPDTNCGVPTGGGSSAVAQTPNLVSLRWSDDRGHSYGSPVSQSIGEAGEYRTSLQWQRLAYARDRVFEISWSVPSRTALQGAWIDVTPAQS